MTLIWLLEFALSLVVCGHAACIFVKKLTFSGPVIYLLEFGIE